MDGGELLQPGVSIKPTVNVEDVKCLLDKLYGLIALEVKELNGYDDKNFHIVVGATIRNKNLHQICADGYVLKIINSLDSKKEEFFEAQTLILMHLNSNNIRCPQPIKTKNGEYSSLETFTSGKHIVRLLEFMRGTILYHVPSSPSLFYQAGCFIAKLDEVFKTFHHPVYDHHKTLWMLEAVPKLEQFIFAIKDEKRKQMVEQIIHQFTSCVLPQSKTLERGMIHGDFNEQNIICNKNSNEEWQIDGVIDFGDSHYTCYLFELAITMAYMILQAKDIDVGGHVLAGYRSVRKLPDEEFKLLKICICARYCQSLVMGAYSIMQDPSNSYISITQAAGWTLLEKLWSEPEDKIYEKWNILSCADER